MTKLITNKGKKYEPDWLFEDEEDDTLYFRLTDTRRIAIIAAEFEDCTSIHYECDYLPPTDYYGYTEILRLVRDGDKVNILLGKKVG